MQINVCWKEKEKFLDRQLYLDNWSVMYRDNMDTGEEELIETYEGLAPIEKVSEQKYLGFVLSALGDNMVNINAVKKKSIGIIRKIMNKLKHLNLMSYYFECSIIFLNVMLRPSILYACEAYYNLSEAQIRQLERIEENFLRQIFKTSKGCPIVQLYLEAGQLPARFEVQRLRLLYLKSLLEEDPNSMVHKFLHLQVENKTRGDWASACFRDLKELQISESLEEIRQMSKSKFNKLLKQRINENALKYLTSKQGSKGKNIFYKSIAMAEYLLPYSKLSIEKKRRLFQIRNKMTLIPNNFQSGKNEETCICGEKENMSHVYYCEMLNENRIIEEKYEEIYKNNIMKQKKILQTFERNLETREKLLKNTENKKELKKNEVNMKRKPHFDPSVDQLNCKIFCIG